MSDLKSDADLLHLALTHEGDEFAARVVNDLQTQLAAMTAERDAANKQTLITEEALENACRLIPGGVLRAAGCHVSEGADTSQWFVDRAYLALEATR